MTVFFYISNIRLADLDFGLNCGGQSPPQAENLTILHLQKCIFYSKNSVSEGVFEAKQGEML